MGMGERVLRLLRPNNHLQLLTPFPATLRTDKETRKGPMLKENIPQIEPVIAPWCGADILLVDRVTTNGAMNGQSSVSPAAAGLRFANIQSETTTINLTAHTAMHGR